MHMEGSGQKRTVPPAPESSQTPGAAPAKSGSADTKGSQKRQESPIIPAKDMRHRTVVQAAAPQPQAKQAAECFDLAATTLEANLGEATSDQAIAQAVRAYLPDAPAACGAGPAGKVRDYLKPASPPPTK